MDAKEQKYQEETNNVDAAGRPISPFVYHQGLKAGTPEGHAQVDLHELNRASVGSIKPASDRKASPVAQFEPAHDPSENSPLGQANDDERKAEALRLLEQGKGSGDPHAKADSVQTVKPAEVVPENGNKNDGTGNPQPPANNGVPPVWGAPGNSNA